MACTPPPRSIRSIALAAALCFASVGSAGAQSVPDDSRQRIHHLLELTGAAEIGVQVATGTADQMLEAVAGQNPDFPASFLQQIRVVTLEFMTSHMEGPDGLMPRIADIYERHFTESEIEGLIAFYETPLGRKLSRKLPEITAEGMAAGREWGAELAPRLRDALVARLTSSMPQAPLLPTALSGLLHRGEGYVFVEHPETGQFVQFAAAEGGGLLMDVPSQTLRGEDEMRKAAEFFDHEGIGGRHESRTVDPSTGREVGIQVSYQAVLDMKPAVVSLIAQRFFADVWGADGSVVLELRYDQGRSTDGRTR